MRARGRSKVWGALLAGAGGGGLILFCGLPQGGEAEPVPAPALVSSRSRTPEQAPPARLDPRFEVAEVVSDSRILPPSGFSEATLFDPPSLATALGWGQSNEALYRLRLSDARRRLQTLDRTYAEAQEPVVRQNLIFHVALGTPWELAEPWLRLRLEEGGADRLDALWALAMSGAEDAIREVEATPPQSHVGRVLVDSVSAHEVLGMTGGAESRARLLPYRALEVVDRAPYFKRTSLLVHLRWFPHPQAGEGSAQSRLWIDGRRAAPLELATRVWATWVRGFPGHPGSDDVALRLGRAKLRQRQHLSAARWFSRASVLPDQDVTWGALNNLLATAEVLLGDAALAELVADADQSGRNRELLQYVQMRRIAARRGCAAGLEEAGRLAASSPEGLVAQAWARRWSAAPPRGLESGVQALGREDPLLRREPAPAAPAASEARALRRVPSSAEAPGQGSRWGEGGSLGRLDPHPEAVSLDLDRLTRQLRLWETLAELAKREEAAEDPGAAADLRYKRAAIFFHQPEALFPVYTRHRHVAESVVDTLWDLNPEDQATFEVGVSEFAAQAQGWTRAMSLLAGFGVRYPGYAGLDEALFTRGLACERFLRGAWCMDRDATIRDLVQNFEDLIEACPESYLRDDATRAVAYWRSCYREAFTK